MSILYDVELLLTLLIGGAIGVLVTVAHHEQTARRRWAYEKEMAEGRKIYAAQWRPEASSNFRSREDAADHR